MANRRLLNELKNALQQNKRDFCEDKISPLNLFLKAFDDAFSLIYDYREHHKEKFNDDIYWTPGDFYYPFVQFRIRYTHLFPIGATIEKEYKKIKEAKSTPVEHE